MQLILTTHNHSHCFGGARSSLTAISLQLISSKIINWSVFNPLRCWHATNKNVSGFHCDYKKRSRNIKLSKTRRRKKSAAAVWKKRDFHNWSRWTEHINGGSMLLLMTVDKCFFLNNFKISNFLKRVVMFFFSLLLARLKSFVIRDEKKSTQHRE